MSRSQSAEAVWSDRLARFGESNLSVAEFCRQEGFSGASFYQWRRRLLENRSTTRRSERSSVREEVSPSEPFVPIKVSTPSAMAEIEFPNGVRIRVPATNAEALRAALHVAHELCRETN